MTTTNTMGGARPRNEGDRYLTPDALARAITDALRDRLGIAPAGIVEPSAGGGSFVRACVATWPGAPLAAVEPSIPDDAGNTPELAASGVQWFEGEWESVRFASRYVDLIVGNPPYNLPGDGRGDAPTTAERHVTLALERLPEGGHVAFLLRLSFLSGGARTERLHSRGLLRALWPVTPRPSFTGGGTDGSEYGVFVWRNGSRSTSVDVRPLVWGAPGRGRGAA